MPDRAGQQLGNYRLLRLLGRGGFAEVYLGEHVYLKRRAALKVLHIALEEEDVEHFLAEAQVLALLDHPHIVRVHEFAVEQGTPFLVMEYASRGTLRQRHPRGSYLSLQRTVAYVKQVAAALQYAHNHQVIHRDVKPENMLLGSQQEVLLSDFGISLLSPSPEQLSTQEMAGTLPYMAPEQIRGKPGFASDQYSLAVIVYEWLCGVRPFEGATWQIAYQQISLAPAPLREHDPSLPEAVEEVVLRALAKDLRDRYVSVQLFAQALERASQLNRLDLNTDTEVTASLDAISPAASSTPAAISKRIFLSAAPEDDAFAARLTSDLQQRGIAVWNEDPEITQNVLKQEHVVRQAIRAIDAVLLVVTPGTPSSRSVREHLRIASLYQRQLVFVWAAGEEIAAVLPDEWGRAAQADLVDARNERYEQALGEIVACLEEIPAEERLHAEPAEELREPRNPYKGLRPFTQNDAADFFGRDSLIAELVERLREAGQSGMAKARLLAVIGPSGSGKSSVVMAGLLPRLQQGALPGSEHWVYPEPMVPGAHPLEALVLRLARLLPDRSLKAMREDLQDESARGLHLLAAQLVKAPGQKVVLLVDQFEELFTQTTAEEERQHFIGLLVRAMTEPQGAVIVILTLRADLYDRPISYPALGRLIVQRQVLVWPMEVQELRAVIKRPAVLPDVQLSFEGNLVGDLLFEVQGQVGALPLLQFTLEQLFERRNGYTLTLQAYHEIGGVRGALAKHAESTYASLPSKEHRQLARALFLRLIDPGLTEQDTTRRRATFSELALPTSEQTELLQQVTAHFLAARLLTANEIAGTPTLEVSHEALIREWPRLSGWLHEAREDILLQQAISEDAEEWQRRKRPAERLYRGSQLKEARAWARRNTPSGHEVAFLRASAAHRVRSVVSALAVLLLVISSIGTAGWFLTHQAPKPPDPTRVTNLLDDGAGSLRWAIANAPPRSTITFDANLRGTILRPSLETRDLLISRNLTIRGPGAGILAISAGGAGRVFSVSKGVFVTIYNLTIKGSTGVGGSYPEGGGIQIEGTLTLINCIVSGNTDIQGGGIDNEGTLTLINSTVSGNSSSNLYASAGGILNGAFNANAQVTLINSTISGNTAYGDDATGSAYGGGIVNYGTLSLINSTVSGNIASTVSGGSAYGGGIVNGGTLSLINSTVSGNSASTGGGGILIQSITNNQTPLIAQADLTFGTIYGNRAAVGADIAVEDGSYSGELPKQVFKPSKQISQVKLRNSIIVGDPAHPGPDIAGTLTSYGYNLFQDNSGAAFDPAASEQHATDKSLSMNELPRLFASPVGLRDNRGPTRTYALSPNSPAVDQIPLAACHINGISTDQRGMRRPDGNEQFCDIGAYESS